MTKTIALAAVLALAACQSPPAQSLTPAPSSKPTTVGDVPNRPPSNSGITQTTSTPEPDVGVTMKPPAGSQDYQNPGYRRPPAME